MKKIFLILWVSIIFCCNLFSATNKYRLRTILIDGSTTYTMVQKKDSWEAVRQVESSGETTLNYRVGYSSTTADAFYAVLNSTTNWNSARDINLY